MYTFFKSVAKNIFPKKFLIANEGFFRKMLIPLYKGKKHECNICSTKLKQFAKLPNGDLICPVCGSIPRARRLYMLLNEEFAKSGFSVLDFSPCRILYRKLKNRKDISYYPSDFEDEFLSLYQYDITAIKTDDSKFDLIICYHILEHIEEDKLAMKELNRVLKSQGKVLIQTPYKNGEIYENKNITTAQQRLKHFGQHDHVRIYSVEGLVNRLQEVGFRTETRTLKGDEYYGFSDNETIIVCEK